MRVSLSTASLYLYPLRQIFALAREVGFEGLELVLNPEIVIRGRDYVQRLSDEYGLPIFSLHPPMIPIPRWKHHHKLLPWMTALARNWDCQFIVIHAPKALTLTEGYGLQYLRAVEACVKELSTSSPRLSIENQAVFQTSDRQYILGTPTNLRHFADEQDLILTLDTAHAASYPYDLLEAYETFASRLGNVHLSDFLSARPIPARFNLQSYFKHHQIPGDGDLPLREFLEHLRGDSYAGLLTLEVSPFALEAWSPSRVKSKLIRCLDFVHDHLGDA